MEAFRGAASGTALPLPLVHSMRVGTSRPPPPVREQAAGVGARALGAALAAAVGILWFGQPLGLAAAGGAAVMLVGGIWVAKEPRSADDGGAQLPELPLQ